MLTCEPGNNQRVYTGTDNEFCNNTIQLCKKKDQIKGCSKQNKNKVIVK